MGPLSHSYAAAGFFPKSTESTIGHLFGRQLSGEPATAGDEPQPDQESVYNQTKYWLIENSPDGRSKLNRQFLRCVQTMNLRNNFLYWDAESKVKQQQAKQSATSASSSIDQSID